MSAIFGLCKIISNEELYKRKFCVTEMLVFHMSLCNTAKKYTLTHTHPPARTHIRASTHQQAHTCKHTYKHTYKFICMFICKHIYAQPVSNTHTHTHKHEYIQRERNKNQNELKQNKAEGRNGNRLITT